MKKNSWRKCVLIICAGIFVPCLFLHAAWQPGLKTGYLNSAWDTNNYPVVTEQQLGPHGAATTAISVWPENRTWVYTGEIYLDGSTYHFAENINNSAVLIIDGVTYISNQTHDVPTKSGPVTLSAGWHAIEIRLCNGGGMGGPTASSGWTSTKGFGYNIDGADTTIGTDYLYPEDDGNMTLFRYDDGIDGIFNNSASDVTSSNAVLNGTLETTNINYQVRVYWGTTDGGTNATAWTYHADFSYPAVAGTFSTNVSLAATDTLTFYRYYASNITTVAWAESSASVLSGEVTAQVFDSNAAEDRDDTGIFRISRSSTATNGALTVYFTLGGTAANGVDYAAVENSVVIPEGESFADVVIEPVEDLDRTEGDESVTLTLTEGSYIIGTSSALSVTVHDSGSMDQWAHSAQFAFTGYSGSEVLTDFPALVLLSTSVIDFNYADFLSGEYDDLRFTDAEMNQFLNYEIESWDTNGISRLWVQVPSLTNNAVIWAHWGRTGMTAPEYTTNGAAWNNGYLSVFHFSETSGTFLKDSVGNCDGSVVGGLDLSEDGRVGSGGRLDGSNDYVSLSDISEIVYQRQFTVSGWMNLDTLGSSSANDGCLFSTSTTSDPMILWYNHTANTTGDKVHSFNVGHTGVSTNRVNSPSGIAKAQTWQYVGAVLDNYNRKIYIDGIQQGSVNGGLRNLGAATQGTIGRWTGSSNMYLDGALDEVRISLASRSADWMMAEYLNMASNSLFQTHLSSTPSLIVEGNPEYFGLPSPAYGSTNLVGGEIFTCTAPATVNIDSTTRYRCSGFTLYTNLLEVVQTGGGNSCVYTNSGVTDRLVWKWTRQYYVDFVNSGPGTFSVAGDWYDENAVVSCTALGVDGSLFVGWDDVENRIPMQQVNDSISITASEPFTLTASFIPALSNSGWYRRLAIAFDDYDRSETLTNFPVMVKLSDGLANYFYYNDMINPDNAGDLRFMDEDGTELFYDIEKWDQSGDSTIWVRLPELSADNNRIYALWGNSAYTNPPVYTSNGMTWDNGYMAVYHLAEESGAVKDSSPFGNTMSTRGVVQQGTNGIAGPAAGWPSYSNNWMQCSASDSLHGMGQLTVQSWIYDTQNDTWPRGLISKRQQSGYKMSYYFFKYNNRNIYFYVGGSGGEFSGTTTGANEWYLVAATYDKNLSSGRMKAYVNGSYKSSRNDSSGNVPIHDSNLHLGSLNANYEYGSNGATCWRGKMDEVRISNKVRSADWLWTEYNNVKNHDTFQRYFPHITGTMILIN